MYPTEFIFPCSGAEHGPAKKGGPKIIPLELRDAKNVTLHVEDLETGLYRSLPPVFADLLDIAAYVYAADQATGRGQKDVDNFGGRWRRKLGFIVPVREPAFWRRAEVSRALKELLDFLSEDNFEFEFLATKKLPGIQGYFDPAGTGAPEKIERVVLFSGGLDSLAGAVHETVECKHKVILVTHRPVSKLNNFQRRLEGSLAEKAGQFKPMHLHVRGNEKSELNKSYLQRTRSFLYAAVGASVARMMGLESVRFYENGVVSLNLPLIGQLVGSRATRTTHPQSLRKMEQLLSLVAGQPFHVKNDFFWDTKADVVRRIIKAGCEKLIGESLSCAHVHAFENQFPHCGVCSQCIDRRMGIVAAGADAYDPAPGYKSDVFIGTRPTTIDAMMVVAYVEHARILRGLRGFDELLEKCPEVVRAVKYLDGEEKSVRERLYAMHVKHGREVGAAVGKMIREHSSVLVDHTRGQGSLLRMVVDSRGGVAAPVSEAREAHHAQENRWKNGETIAREGRLQFRANFNDLWLGEEHYDLRSRNKARLCIQYLVEQKAFDSKSARHLIDEIDVFVRKHGDFLPAADIKIDHYFTDRTGKLSGLRKELIARAGRDGRYFLKVE